MANIITYYNPLDPDTRRVEVTSVKTSTDLIEKLSYDSDFYDVIVSRNGRIEYAEFEIIDGDSVALILSPRGGVVKSILKVVAVIAVAVFAAPALAGLAFAAGSTGYFLTMAAVNILGGLLINSVLPPTVPDFNSNSFTDQSQTYGWNINATNLFQQGVAIPRLFGTHVVKPPIISSYVQTSGDKQYLNVLMALNDGEIQSCTDITINGNPISNYDGVSYEVRLGTNEQSIIGYFDNTRFDKAVNSKIVHDADWDYSTTDGDAVTGVTIVISFPNGLYKIDMDGDDAGDYETARWLIYAEYSIDGGTNWQTIANPYTISANTRTPIRRTISKSGFAPSTVQVRWKGHYDTNDGGSEHPSRENCYVEYITEEITDDFTYPNTALLAVRALATDQLSGSMPTIACKISEGTTNPADICEKMLLECGTPSEQLSTTQFTEFRDWCTSKNYTCNIYLDTTTTLRKALDFVSACGRARVEQFGSHFVPVIDKPEEVPVQGFLFTLGNINKDSFTTEFLPLTDRANVIEISYYDATKDNEKTVLEVSNESYDDEEEETRVTVNYIGCTDKDMAISYADYLLKYNRYLTMTSTWESDVDALVCKYGDVVQVSHDVPRWGFSGRLVSATTTGVVLDRKVDITEPGAHYIRIMSPNDNGIIEVQVSEGVGTYSELTFTEPLAEAPDALSNYAFGPVGRVTKLMRIMQITTAGDTLKRKISAIEYIPEIYEEGEITFDEIAYPTVPQEAIKVTALEQLVYGSSGDYQSVVNVDWLPISGSDGYNWDIYLENETNAAGEFVFIASTSRRNYTIQANYFELGNTYRIYICPSGKGSSNTGGNTSQITIQGKLLPPATVLNFVAYFRDTRTDIDFYWDEVNNIDLAGYEIREGGSWETSTLIARVGKTTTHTIHVGKAVNTDYTFWIKAYDNSVPANYSTTGSYYELSVNTNATSLVVPTNLVLDTGVTYEDGVAKTVLYADWDANAEVSTLFHHYEIQLRNNTLNDYISGYSSLVSQYQWIVNGDNSYSVRVCAIDKNDNPTAFTDWEDGVLAERATAKVFQWNISTPTTPTGSATYTFATEGVSPIPSGWLASPGSTPSAGYNLYAAKVNVFAAEGTETVDFDWLDGVVELEAYAGAQGEDGDPGLDGADGVDGEDGVSIIWKGTYAQHIISPENGWAYYNSTDGKSYVYQDGTWYQMTIDGADGAAGADGTDGVSIVWKGESSSPPASPEENWVYKDTDNGIVYIYNGSSWEVMTVDGAPGADGADGTPGNDIEIEYSVNGSTGWHDTFVTGDKYLRQSTDGGSTWSPAIKFVGDDGADGADGNTGAQGASARVCYTKTTLSSLASTPTTVTTSGSSSFPANNSWGTGTVWQATPPVITAGESVYVSDGIYNPATGNTVWAVPYLATLKVGSLSAITTNTGNLLISDYVKTGGSPAISGTTMTGSGAIQYADGRFCFGNAATNLSFNGSTLTLNGEIIDASNIPLGVISAYYTHVSTTDYALSSSSETTTATLSYSCPVGSTVVILAQIDTKFHTASKGYSISDGLRLDGNLVQQEAFVLDTRYFYNVTQNNVILHWYTETTTATHTLQLKGAQIPSDVSITQIYRKVLVLILKR